MTLCQGGHKAHRYHHRRYRFVCAVFFFSNEISSLCQSQHRGTSAHNTTAADMRMEHMCAAVCSRPHKKECSQYLWQRKVHAMNITHTHEFVYFMLTWACSSLLTASGGRSNKADTLLDTLPLQATIQPLHIIE